MALMGEATGLPPKWDVPAAWGLLVLLPADLREDGSPPDCPARAAGGVAGVLLRLRGADAVLLAPVGDFVVLRLLSCASAETGEASTCQICVPGAGDSL